MTTFQAVATGPNCAYNESAEMADDAFGAILATARNRFGKVPSGEVDANNKPILRDMTNEETVKKMLGKFLLDWSNEAAADARQAAIEALAVTAPDWTVLPPAAPA